AAGCMADAGDADSSESPATDDDAASGNLLEYGGFEYASPQGKLPPAWQSNETNVSGYALVGTNYAYKGKRGLYIYGADGDDSPLVVSQTVAIPEHQVTPAHGAWFCKLTAHTKLVSLIEENVGGSSHMTIEFLDQDNQVLDNPTCADVVGA